MKVGFNAYCVATYKGELELPNNIDQEDKKAVHKYILEHLDEVPASDLLYLDDTDEPVTENDIEYIR